MARVSSQCFQDETVQALTVVLGVVEAFDLAQDHKSPEEDRRDLEGTLGLAQNHKSPEEDRRDLEGILDPEADHILDPEEDHILDPEEDHILDPEADHILDPEADHTAPRVEVQALARHHRVNYQ